MKMIKNDDRAEIPPLNRGRIAAPLVHAMHMTDEESLSKVEFISVMTVVEMKLRVERFLKLWLLVVKSSKVFYN